MGFSRYDPEQMTAEEGQKFDYLNGRVMKIDLSGDELDTRLYNRDNGVDSAENVIRALRIS